MLQGTFRLTITYMDIYIKTSDLKHGHSLRFLQFEGTETVGLKLRHVGNNIVCTYLLMAVPSHFLPVLKL
jgi:hypothetical protein